MEKILGINGFGRIGKLTLWLHVYEKKFKKIVVNTGRFVGKSMEDITHYIERDSTYGKMSRYLYGLNAPDSLIEKIDESQGLLVINGISVYFLRQHRNPIDIQWKDFGVTIVVDTTGKFKDPTLPAEHPKGSIQGHLAAGVQKVLISAPFKIKDNTKSMPEDVITIVNGINHHDYNPNIHRIVSGASCTTTGLTHMMKPLLDNIDNRKFLTALMATIHAATGTQSILDSLHKFDATDLRKGRSIFNNIILTSTGAAKASSLVIPEMNEFGFLTDSVRVPTSTASLILLGIDFRDEFDKSGQSHIRRETLNEIYRERSGNHILFSEKQNVSADIVGDPHAVIIEGQKTHTRTAQMTIPLTPYIKQGLIQSNLQEIQVPTTKALIYGWYDNEWGYVCFLAKNTFYIAEI